jgi:hypothetical protein
VAVHAFLKVVPSSHYSAQSAQQLRDDVAEAAHRANNLAEGVILSGNPLLKSVRSPEFQSAVQDMLDAHPHGGFQRAFELAQKLQEACSSAHKLAWDVAQKLRQGQHQSAEAALQLSWLIEANMYEAQNLVHEATQRTAGPGYRPRQQYQHRSQGSDDFCKNWSYAMCQCLRVLCIDHFPNCGGSHCLGSAEQDMVPQFTRKNAMLTQRFCDRQRDDSQKMHRLHFNSAEEFSASASPEHPNAEAELRERRALEVRQQLQRPRPPVTTHVDDLLNLATEQHAAVIEADEKGKKAEELRKTEAAAAMEYTWAAVVSAQARMDAQAASAGAGAAGGLPPHLSPHP